MAREQMKKVLLISLAVLAAFAAPTARATSGPLNLLLAGGPEDNVIRIALSPDGRNYVISSIVTLEAGGDLCSHPEERPNELVCKAPEIAGFEVNVAGGDDTVVLTPDVPVPATLRGGTGQDRLFGGGAGDKLVGGPGGDVLSGRRGNDWIFGGNGQDRLVGGPGDDQLFGGPHSDVLLGGSGRNQVTQ
jgi:Ca2+-binding RTX toxin-like protein